jgi:hypothetical protein
LPGEMLAGSSIFNDASCRFTVSSVTNSAQIKHGLTSTGSNLNSVVSPNLILRWRSTCGTQFYSSLGGDSGSAVLARFNNIWKIIGIHYGAGLNNGEYMSFVSRIDHIAPLLRIEPYYGQTLNTGREAPTNTIIVKNKHSLSSFRHNTDGRTYYQVGTTTETANLTNLPI